MAKQLILFRHAEAGPAASQSADAMRELTGFGKEQARVMSEYFFRENIPVDAIFCSPSVRTRQTTKILIQRLSFDPARVFYPHELYDASLDILVEILRDLDDAYHHIVVVGHNSALSYMAEYLTSSAVSLTTAAAAMVRLDIPRWREITKHKGALLHVETPAMQEESNRSNDQRRTDRTI